MNLRKRLAYDLELVIATIALTDIASATGNENCFLCHSLMFNSKKKGGLFYFPQPFSIYIKLFSLSVYPNKGINPAYVIRYFTKHSNRHLIGIKSANIS